MHLTSEMGLNSFKLEGLAFFGTRAMNDALHPLGMKPVS